MPYESKWMSATEIKEKVDASSDDAKTAESNKKSAQTWARHNKKKQNNDKCLYYPKCFLFNVENCLWA